MIKKILLWLFALLALWSAGLMWFVAQIPAAAIAASARADAIVILTGGKGRLEYGLQLLAEGKGKALFITGVGNASREDLLRQAPSDTHDALMALPPEVIRLGHQAENTIGNAEETAHWISSKNIRSILLVTSNYHMPRAVSEFNAAVPGLTLIPAPVFPDNFNMNGWWQRDDDRDRLLTEYHKLLAGKLRHWLVSLMPLS